MATIKISQLPAKGANLDPTDLIEISEFDGSGYTSKSITGQEIIDAATGSGVTSVTGTAPIASTGGTSPAISIATANTTTTGAISSTDWNTFNNKQDTLVSGTNIKTINGSSILGSGDLSVGSVTSVTGTSPISSSGGATPAISIATADTSTTGALTSTDWNTFNNKQNALTLTTTGTSGAATLVGATLNIPQYSGGGLVGVHAQIGLSSGQSIFTGTTTQGLASTSTVINRLYAVPFIPNQNITTSAMYMNVTTAVASANCRILVYSSLNGLPDQKLYESSNLDCSTTGIKTATTTFTFTAGTTYWVCIHASSTATISFINTSGLIPLSITGVSNPNTYVHISATFGSAPTTFGTPTITNGNAPFIGITKA